MTLSGPAIDSKSKLREKKKICSESWCDFSPPDTHFTGGQFIKACSHRRKWGQKQYQESRWKVISMAGAKRGVNASGFGLNASQMRGKEKLKIPRPDRTPP